jgi:hypothetical protein
MKRLVQTLCVVVMGLWLSACFTAKDGVLQQVAMVSFSKEPLRLTNITKKYISEPGKFPPEFDGIRDAGVAIPMDSGGTQAMMFIPGKDPDPTVVPDQAYFMQFYDIAPGEHLMRFIPLKKGDDGELKMNSLVLMLAFVHREGDVLKVTSWADPEFLTAALAGQIAQKKPAVATDNPFAAIGADIVQAAPLESATDAKSDSVEFASFEDIKRVSAAIKSANYVSSRTLFFEVKPF